MVRKLFHMVISLVGSILVCVHNFYSHRLIPFIKQCGCTRPSPNNSLMSIKQSVMNPKNIQQEILVFTQTSFAQKTLAEKGDKNENTYPAEELEKAFWNGMLNEMLPELMLPIQEQKSEVFIWQIYSSEFSLLINTAETPDMAKDSHSLNPYFFLSNPKMN